jgi:hypothetical protein
LKTLEHGKIPHVHVSAELILWTSLWYQKQSTGSKQPCQKNSAILNRNRNTVKKHIKAQKTICISQIMDLGYINPKIGGSNNDIKTHCDAQVWYTLQWKTVIISWGN